METSQDINTGSVQPSPSFGMTDSAAQRIAHLKAKENKPGLYFRITVKGGGCSGFQYDFQLDDAPLAEGEMTFTHNDASVVMDDVSLGLLAGGVLDYVEDLSSAGFEIKNPNATARCGCGNSFSVSL